MAVPEQTVAPYIYILFVCIAAVLLGIAIGIIVPWRLAHKYIKKEKELKGQFHDYYRDVLEVEIGNKKIDRTGKKLRRKKKKNTWNPKIEKKVVDPKDLIIIAPKKGRHPPPKPNPRRVEKKAATDAKAQEQLKDLEKSWKARGKK